MRSDRGQVDDIAGVPGAVFVGIVVALLGSGCASSDVQFTSDTGLPTPDLGVTDTQVPDTVEQNPIDTIAPDTLPGPPQDAILVSPIGVDTSDCGTEIARPCQTIGFGITRASSYQPPRPVALAGGNYAESVTLKSGVSLLGGYNAEFVRGGAGNTTTVIKGLADGGQAVAVRAVGLLLETRLESLTVETPDAPGTGESSYAIHVLDSPGLQVVDCRILAGAGGPAEDGASTSTPAPSGTPGTNGHGGGQNFLDPIEPIGCPNPESQGFGDRGSGGAAAVRGDGLVCQGAGGAGGFGGIDSCDGLAGETAAGALVGAVDTCAAASAGQGGNGGKGGSQDRSTCETETKGADGAAGCDGRAGTSGTHGLAGQGGSVVNGYWAGAAGADGSDASNDATGGGGGGGGGGGDCDWPDCIGQCISDRGGGGGGGGSAGCPGQAGTGGTAGGGSFGVFLVNSSASIVVKNSEIVTGDGGRGGNGGPGQPGGQGAAGGGGGAAFQESGAGSGGGKGGDGGHGGHGGGGAGGPSVGIFVAAGQPPAVTNTKITLGQAGAGGQSAGNPGADGLRIDLATAH